MLDSPLIFIFKEANNRTYFLVFHKRLLLTEVKWSLDCDACYQTTSFQKLWDPTPVTSNMFQVWQMKFDQNSTIWLVIYDRTQLDFFDNFKVLPNLMHLVSYFLDSFSNGIYNIKSFHHELERRIFSQGFPMDLTKQLEYKLLASQIKVNATETWQFVRRVLMHFKLETSHTLERLHPFLYNQRSADLLLLQQLWDFLLIIKPCNISTAYEFSILWFPIPF